MDGRDQCFLKYIHMLLSQIFYPILFQLKSLFVFAFINRERKKEFPPHFIKNFGKQIPNTTKLEVKGYHEKQWEVGVEKNGKNQCFSEGWREFVEENNLEEFDFLVFKYLVDSKSFKVTNYGRITCCVKEFPVSRKRVQIMKGARRNKSKIEGDKAYERDVILIDSDDEDINTLKQTIMDRYFFKILIKDFPSYLKFPPVFTHKFGRQIPNTTKVEVKGYHQKSWEVKVEKDGKIQCFSKGWRKFVEENNLEELDFLVFKYLTDSKSFKVTIFGRTGCVKEFPVSRVRNSKLDGGKRKRVQEDDDDSDTNHIIRTKKSKFDGDKAYERDLILIDSDDEDIDTLKQTTVCKERTKEHHIKEGGKRKRVEKDDDEDDSNTDQMMKGARMTMSKVKGYECDVIPECDDEDKSTLKRPVCNGKTKEHCSVVQKASKSGRKCKCGEGPIKFNSKNPFFEAELHDSHFLNNGYVHIRRCFFMEHLSMKKVKAAKLYISKDILKLGIYVIQKRREARISSGWPKFVKDYGLEMGDFCVFEMIESNNINLSFHVHVYRKAGDKNEFVKIF